MVQKGFQYDLDISYTLLYSLSGFVLQRRQVDRRDCSRWFAMFEYEFIHTLLLVIDTMIAMKSRPRRLDYQSFHPLLGPLILTFHVDIPTSVLRGVQIAAAGCNILGIGNKNASDLDEAEKADLSWFSPFEASVFHAPFWNLKPAIGTSPRNIRIQVSLILSWDP